MRRKMPMDPMAMPRDPMCVYLFQLLCPFKKPQRGWKQVTKDERNRDGYQGEGKAGRDVQMYSNSYAIPRVLEVQNE